MAATVFLGTKPDGTVAPLSLDANGALVVTSTIPSGATLVPGIGGVSLLGTKPDGTVVPLRFDASGALVVAAGS